MKNKIFQIIEKIAFPYIVLEENNICWVNSYFKNSFLSQYNIHFSNLVKFEYEWDYYLAKKKLLVINQSNSIIIVGILTSEFTETENFSDRIYRIYKIEKIVNPNNEIGLSCFD